MRTGWSILALLCLLGCRDSAEPTTPELVVVTPLEDVDFTLLEGGRIAFQREASVGSGRPSAFSSFFVVDGTEARSWHWNHNPLRAAPSLAPNGERVAYLKISDPDSWWNVFTSNAVGEDEQDVTAFLDLEGPPTWTVDGTRLVITVYQPDRASANVFSKLPTASPASLQQLTDFTLPPPDAELPDCPRIDGQVPVSQAADGRLTFACWRTEINVLTAAGEEAAVYVPTNSPDVAEVVIGPVWSPDDTRIAFIEARYAMPAFTSLGLDLKVMDADGGNVRTVATVSQATIPIFLASQPNTVSVCWLPSGTRLVFAVPDAAGQSHIWVVNEDGSGLAQLTTAANVYDSSVSCAR